MARTMLLGDSEVLAVVHLAQHGELTQTRLAELLDLSSGGTAALVQRLERGGHVRRREGEQDKRLRFVSLSEATAERAARFSQPLHDEIDELLQQAGGGEAVLRFLDDLAALTETHAEQARRRPPSPGPEAAGVRPGLWG